MCWRKSSGRVLSKRSGYAFNASSVWLRVEKLFMKTTGTDPFSCWVCRTMTSRNEKECMTVNRLLTPFLAQAGSVGQREFDPAAAVFTVVHDDMLQAAFLKRDPPIPRLSA